MNDPDHNSDTLRPVAAPEHLAEPLLAAKTKEHGGDFYSRLIFWLCLILAIVSVIASGWAFIGFAENDTGFMHLLSAFLLCFGIGALAYGPLGLTAYFAKKAIYKPMPRLRAIIVILLAWPWLPFAFILAKVSQYGLFAGILAAFTAILIILWAVRYFTNQ